MKVRSDILRNYQTLHTWTGIVSGLFLFIGFFAGAIIMFQAAINDWATPPSNHLNQIELKQLDSLTKQVLEQYPESQKQLTISLEPNKSPITWRQHGSDREVLMEDKIWYATLDANQEVITNNSTNNELTYLLDMLHRTAGIAGEVGHDHAGVYVLGIASFLYFVALVSGVIFLLPTLVKSFFALRKNKGANRFWLDSHNLIGITSLPFHIVISITVVVFAFHDFLYGGLTAIYGDKPLFPREAPSKIEYKLEQLPSISQYIEKANQYAPDHKVTSITLSGLATPRASAAIALENKNTIMRGPTNDFVFMHPYSLKINTSSVVSGDQGIWGSLVTSFFALHFGSYGGNWGRWAYFIMGLMGAFLFYSGNLLWLEKRRQKNKAQTKSVNIMAKLTVGVCIGSLLGVVSCFALTKWLVATQVSINSFYLAIYYLVFLLSMLASFTLGAAKAGIYLLKALAIICLAVPLSSVIAVLFPMTKLWAASNSSQIVLEVTFFIFASLFYQMSKKAKVRAQTGAEDSIWSIRQIS